MEYLCGGCLKEYRCNAYPESLDCEYIPDPVQAKAERAASMDNELKRNGSGYVDPTAAKAILRLQEKQKRVSRIIETMKNAADVAGFEIEGRIVLKDKRTGEIWK